MSLNSIAITFTYRNTLAECDIAKEQANTRENFCLFHISLSYEPL